MRTVLAIVSTTTLVLAGVAGCGIEDPSSAGGDINAGGAGGDGAGGTKGGAGGWASGGTSSGGTSSGGTSSGGTAGASGGTAGGGGTAGPEGRTEVCGNGVDDDADGKVDNGCECTAGTVRSCWLGPPGLDGVGVCHGGQQRCEPGGSVAVWGFCVDQVLPGPEILSNNKDDDCDGTVDEGDGRCEPTAETETGLCVDGVDNDCDTLSDCQDPDCAGATECAGNTCTDVEKVCWGGFDEDCDELVDCDDPDCAADPSCHMGPCPPGQTPVYNERELPRVPGPSGIAVGDGEPVMPVACGSSTCPQGLVEVNRVGAPKVCVPPPPDCNSGEYATYVGSTWRCEPPCDLEIQYGYIFAFKRVCAGEPQLSCPSGQVPTFHESQEEWVCAPKCNNTTYDIINYKGTTVCVPC